MEIAKGLKRVAVNRRHSQFEPGAMCCQNTCTSAMDIYGYHALVCKGHLLSRHNTVRDALYDLMVKARFNPMKDAPVTCLGMQSGRPTAFRPADILMAGDDFDRDCVDVTVVSPLVTNHQRVVEVGKAAQAAEDRKFAKHRAACEMAGLGFKAFALDVLFKAFMARSLELEPTHGFAHSLRGSCDGDIVEIGSYREVEVISKPHQHRLEDQREKQRTQWVTLLTARRRHY